MTFISFSFSGRSTLASRCSSPSPDTRYCPVSSSILTTSVGSSRLTCRRNIMSFGRSPGSLHSMPLVTTGSNMCFIASNGSISLFVLHIVSPEKVSVSPTMPTMLPAGISSICTRCGPLYTDTCCTRFVICCPTSLTSSPFRSVPEKIRPVATSPACGSGTTFVIIIASGPFGSIASMLLPISLSRSPCHSLCILYF